MPKTMLLERIARLEYLASGSKLRRLLANPLRYLNAISFKEFVYPRTQKERLVQTEIITGDKIDVLLPAATDIYLTGGKTHSSEVRLARFLVQHLRSGDCFWDIGAHYGYFSLIAAQLVGAQGSVLSIEAAPKTYAVLMKNAGLKANIDTMNLAVAAESGSIKFYQFPNKYSEYNTLDISQYKHEEWLKQVDVEEVEIPALSLYELYVQTSKVPNLIKIDVEGGEAAAIQGAKQLLEQFAPGIVMEYLEEARNNEAHKEAAQMLLEHGYNAMAIAESGSLLPLENIDAYLYTNGLDSDNIVFIKHVK